jgi:predicted metal-dependent phosphoesterase TrpH
MSDGLLEPAALVAAAREASLSALSITDHDTLDAYRDLDGSDPGVRLVVGTELSAFHDGGEIHILGYFVDPDHAGLNSIVERAARSRRARADRMLARLAAAGVRIPDEERARILDNRRVGRPHIARAVVAAGAAATTREAFNRFLVPGTPAYERKPDLPSAGEVLRAIAAAGGVAAWAHPGTDCLIDAGPLRQLQDAGLAGLEAYHPRHSRGEMESLAQLARRRGLIATGGSDFHGDGREGARVGDHAVPVEVIDELAQRRGRGS